MSLTAELGLALDERIALLTDGTRADRSVIAGVATGTHSANGRPSVS